jgi:DNA polymerase-3 subunit delta
MLVKPAESERIIARFPADFIAALLFGPDQGLVRERAERLVTTIVPDLRDPFRIAEIDGAGLLEDPAWLDAEVSAISMTGGRRVVRVRAAGNALARTFKSLLAGLRSDALVVAEAGDLARDSSLRELFEEASNAAAIPS